MEDPNVIINDLVRLVGQAFYSVEKNVVLNALIRERYVKDDDLAKKLKLSTKKVRTILNELRSERLVACQSKREQNAFARSESLFWYIDSRNVIDATRYRIHKMQRKVQDYIRRENEVEQYECRGCGAQFTALDAMFLLRGDQFVCSYCGTTLETSQKAPETSGSKDLKALMDKQLKPIIDQLNKTNNLIIPITVRKDFEVQALTKEEAESYKELLRKSVSMARKEGGAGGGSGGGAGGPAGPRPLALPGLPAAEPQYKVLVEMGDDDDLDIQATRQKPEAEIEKKELPFFLQRDYNEEARYGDAVVSNDNDAVAPATTAPSEIISGGAGAATQEANAEIYNAYIKAYYEQLLRQQQQQLGAAAAAPDEAAAAAATTTVPAVSVGQQEQADGTTTTTTTTGDGEEEEDEFTSVKIEGHDEADEWETVEPHNAPQQQQILQHQTEEAQAEAHHHHHEEDAEVYVSVAGEPVPISSITQTEIDQMTPDEYRDYYEKYSMVYGT